MLWLLLKEKAIFQAVFSERNLFSSTSRNSGIHLCHKNSREICTAARCKHDESPFWFCLPRHFFTMHRFGSKEIWPSSSHKHYLVWSTLPTLMMSGLFTPLVLSCDFFFQNQGKSPKIWQFFLCKVLLIHFVLSKLLLVRCLQSCGKGSMLPSMQWSNF